MLSIWNVCGEMKESIKEVSKCISLNPDFWLSYPIFLPLSEKVTNFGKGPFSVSSEIAKTNRVIEENNNQNDEIINEVNSNAYMPKILYSLKKETLNEKGRQDQFIQKEDYFRLVLINSKMKMQRK